LIKDVVMGLTQIPAKTIAMDIVVADILPKFGMLALHRIQGIRIQHIENIRKYRAIQFINV